MKKQLADSETITNQTEQSNQTTTNNTIISSNQSAITGELIPSTTIKEKTEIIQQFVTYCNNKNVVEAYSLLSKDCKNEIYKTQEDFEKNYINNIFKSGIPKIAKVENWIDNIYKVDFVEDIMSTGIINGESVQDYITLVTEDDVPKMNISGFINKEEYSNQHTSKDITFTVVKRQIFMDYEEYTLNIHNNGKNTILLDSKQNTKSIYLSDDNGMKYYAYNHEILDSLIKIKSGTSKQIKIKFSKAYNSRREMESLIFSDVILNYEEYINGKQEKQKIIINL